VAATWPHAAAGQCIAGREQLPFRENRAGIGHGCESIGSADRAAVKKCSHRTLQDINLDPRVSTV
jgi:hypothetical protein